jgi:hypothetical protein
MDAPGLLEGADLDYGLGQERQLMDISNAFEATVEREMSAFCTNGISEHNLH